MRVTVIATGFEQADDGNTVVKESAGKTAAPAAGTAAKTSDISDIDEIFKIFGR